MKKPSVLSRRQFLETAGLGSAALAAVSCLTGETASQPSRPPNFVVIFIDDMGYRDLGCFGAPAIRTPRLDRIAEEGVRFTSFYAQPVCTPSRAALLTGCYPMRVGLPRVLFPFSKEGIHSDEITIAEMLKAKGYATACIGKWHLGHLPPFLPTRHGFDHYFGLPYSNDMEAEKRGDPPLPLMRGEEIVEQPANQDTLTQRYTEDAVAFIREHREEPFFLYLPHTMVHVPLHVSDKFRDKSAGGLYGDAVEEIDWSTGVILDTLEELGVDKDTLVMFTSDNGPWLVKKEHGGSALPLRAGKGTTYEGGVRVPCIVRWPGHAPEGAVCGEIVSEMDLLPTFAALSGASMPTDRIIDGKDIGDLIAHPGQAKTPHDALFYYNSDQLEAVRSGPWKLILPHQKVERALYNLEKDISETTDVSDQHPEVVARLEALAERCRDDLGDGNAKRQGRNCRPRGLVE